MLKIKIGFAYFYFGRILIAFPLAFFLNDVIAFVAYTNEKRIDLIQVGALFAN